MSLTRGRYAAYQIFDELEKGQVVILTSITSKPEVLVSYGKDYIDKGGNILFSDDYTKIMKTGSITEIIALQK